MLLASYIISLRLYVAASGWLKRNLSAMWNSLVGFVEFTERVKLHELVVGSISALFVAK